MRGAAQSLRHPPELRDQSRVFVPKALIWIPHPGRVMITGISKLFPWEVLGFMELQPSKNLEVSLPLHLTFVILKTPQFMEIMRDVQGGNHEVSG